MSTRLVQLGKDGPLVPALGFGAMGLTQSTYGSIPSNEQSFALLDRAYEIGARHWDTSDLYGSGEELIGEWLERTGRRGEIFLATKFGFVKGSNYEVDSSPEYCKEACTKSLQILGIDCIDLYYMHHANPDTPIEQTMRALKELQTEGKIKHIGLSAISSKTLRRAVKIAPVAAIQADYSVFMLDIENPASGDLLATCRELGVSVVAAMPLGRGLLTSTFAQNKSLGDERDMRSQVLPRFMEQNRAQNINLAGRFRQIAEKKGCTMTQLALAWLLKQGEDIIPIPGTKQIRYLEENWASLDVVLTREDEAEVRNFADSAEVAGSAMPPQFAGYNFTDTVEESDLRY